MYSDKLLQLSWQMLEIYRIKTDLVIYIYYYAESDNTSKSTHMRKGKKETIHNWTYKTKQHCQQMSSK